jgi:hypothetical protein
LLKVSQLLTTVASPVAAVEEEHGDDVVQLVRDAERAAVHGGRLKPGESLPDAKGFHVGLQKNFILSEAKSLP